MALMRLGAIAVLVAVLLVALAVGIPGAIMAIGGGDDSSANPNLPMRLLHHGFHGGRSKSWSATATWIPCKHAAWTTHPAPSGLKL